MIVCSNNNFDVDILADAVFSPGELSVCFLDTIFRIHVLALVPFQFFDKLCWKKDTLKSIVKILKKFENKKKC